MKLGTFAFILCGHLAAIAPAAAQSIEHRNGLLNTDDTVVVPGEIALECRIDAIEARPCYPDDDQYQPSWDWTDTSEFRTFNLSQIPPPWPANEHYGLDVTDDYHLPSRGWRLYSKKMTCFDRGVRCEAGTNPLKEEVPFFVLYNVHTGTLRVFAYFAIDSGDADTLFAEMSLQQRGSDQVTRFPDVFANYRNDAAGPAKEVSETISIQLQPGNRWGVFDFELAFTEDLVDTNISFVIDVWSQRNSVLELSGNIALKFEATSPVESDTQNLYSLLEAAPGIYKKFNQPSALIDELSTRGVQLESDENRIRAKAGTTLTALASALSGFDVYAGIISAGLGVFDVVSSLFSSPQGAKIGYKSAEGTVELSGTLTSQRIRELPIAFGLHRSSFRDQLNMSELEFDQNVGLYRISRIPKLFLGMDGFISEEVTSDIVKINPGSNMELVEFDYSFEIDFNPFAACINSVSNNLERHEEILDLIAGNGGDAHGLGAREADFLASQCSNSLRLTGSSLDSGVFDEFRLENDDFEVSFIGEQGGVISAIRLSRVRTAPTSKDIRIRSRSRWSRNSKIGYFWQPTATRYSRFINSWEHAQRAGALPRIDSASLIIAMKFRHSYDPTITSTVLRRLDVEIVEESCAILTERNWNAGVRGTETYLTVPICDELGIDPVLVLTSQ